MAYTRRSLLYSTGVSCFRDPNPLGMRHPASDSMPRLVGVGCPFKTSEGVPVTFLETHVVKCLFDARRRLFPKT